MVCCGRNEICAGQEAPCSTVIRVKDQGQVWGRTSGTAHWVGCTQPFYTAPCNAGTVSLAPTLTITLTAAMPFSAIPFANYNLDCSRNCNRTPDRGRDVLSDPTLTPPPPRLHPDQHEPPRQEPMGNHFRDPEPEPECNHAMPCHAMPCLSLSVTRTVTGT